MRKVPALALGALAAVLASLPLAAEAPDTRGHMVSEEEAPLWAAVGRLNVAGNRFCTATLISPDEVLTAAHCLFHPVTGHQAHPEDIKFVAGLRRESYAALRGVRSFAVLPEFRPEAGQYIELSAVSFDLALLRLDSPIPETDLRPMALAEWPNGEEPLSITGFGRDRPQIATLRDDCMLTDALGLALRLSCPILAGLSGAPVVVMRDGVPKLVAVVSAATGTVTVPDGVIVVLPGPRLQQLRNLLP